MKKTSKIIAAILVGSMLLPCVSVGAESLVNDAVVLNTIDKNISIVIDDKGSIQSFFENAERINTTVPNYKKAAKAQKLKEFTIPNDETVYLCFDMIDGGTSDETCDITLTEKVGENEKTIETVIVTIENLKLKSIAKINGFDKDKSYYITVQSKTKSGNASFLFCKKEELKMDFVLQPSDNIILNRDLDFVATDDNVNLVYWTDIPEWEEYFETLKEYGIFVGYDDGDVKPYNVITRAETAKVLCAALGINPESATEQHFSDVDSSHWAYRYINALADMKIVAGTENNLFEPDREATINEVVKMLVCAIGYEHKANANGGYPNGYIQTANNIGLMKDLEQALTREYCQRYIAFTLFYNALDIPFLIQTGFDNGSAEFAVADGEDGRDYITIRYKITGKRNEG